MTLAPWVAEVGAGIVLLGALVAVAGAIGLVRFPDVYSRIHAVGLVDSMGAALVVIGLCLVAAPDWALAIKLVLLAAVIFVSAPTAAHALANTAFGSGVAPWPLVRSGEDTTQATSDPGASTNSDERAGGRS